MRSLIPGEFHGSLQCIEKDNRQQKCHSGSQSANPSPCGLVADSTQPGQRYLCSGKRLHGPRNTMGTPSGSTVAAERHSKYTRRIRMVNGSGASTSTTTAALAMDAAWATVNQMRPLVMKTNNIVPPHAVRSLLVHNEKLLRTLIDEISPAETERRLKRFTFAALKLFIRESFPEENLGVYVAGSSACDVDLTSSDLDVVVTSNCLTRMTRSLITKGLAATTATSRGHMANNLLANASTFSAIAKSMLLAKENLGGNDLLVLQNLSKCLANKAKVDAEFSAPNCPLVNDQPANNWPFHSTDAQLVENARVPILLLKINPWSENNLLTDESSSNSGGPIAVCDLSVNSVNSIIHTEYFKSILQSCGYDGCDPNNSCCLSCCSSNRNGFHNCSNSLEKPLLRFSNLSQGTLKSFMRLVKYWLKVRHLPSTREGGLPTILWMILCLFTTRLAEICYTSSASDLFSRAYDTSELKVTGVGTKQRFYATPSMRHPFGTQGVGDAPAATIRDLGTECDFVEDTSATMDVAATTDAAVTTDASATEAALSSADVFRLSKLIDLSSSVSPFFWGLKLNGDEFSNCLPYTVLLGEFFSRLSGRPLLSKTVLTISPGAGVSWIPKEQDELRARVLSIASHGGVWDELVSVEDPAGTIQDDHINSPSRLLLNPSNVVESLLNTPYDINKTHSRGSSSIRDLAGKVSSATWLVYQYELKRAERIFRDFFRQSRRFVTLFLRFCVTYLAELVKTFSSATMSTTATTNGLGLAQGLSLSQLEQKFEVAIECTRNLIHGNESVYSAIFRAGNERRYKVPASVDSLSPTCSMATKRTAGGEASGFGDVPSTAAETPGEPSRPSLDWRSFGITLQNFGAMLELDWDFSSRASAPKRLSRSGSINSNSNNNNAMPAISRPSYAETVRAAQIQTTASSSPVNTTTGSNVESLFTSTDPALEEVVTTPVIEWGANLVPRKNESTGRNKNELSRRSPQLPGAQLLNKIGSSSAPTLFNSGESHSEMTGTSGTVDAVCAQTTGPARPLHHVSKVAQIAPMDYRSSTRHSSIGLSTSPRGDMQTLTLTTLENRLKERIDNYLGSSSCAGKPTSNFCLVLLEGKLFILQLRSVCADRDGWWSSEFLSRRDIRSVLHGRLFRCLLLPQSHFPENKVSKMSSRRHRMYLCNARYFAAAARSATLIPKELLGLSVPHFPTMVNPERNTKPQQRRSYDQAAGADYSCCGSINRSVVKDNNLEFPVLDDAVEKASRAGNSISAPNLPHMTESASFNDRFAVKEKLEKALQYHGGPTVPSMILGEGDDYFLRFLHGDSDAAGEVKKRTQSGRFERAASLDSLTLRGEASGTNDMKRPNIPSEEDMIVLFNPCNFVCNLEAYSLDDSGGIFELAAHDADLVNEMLTAAKQAPWWFEKVLQQRAKTASHGLNQRSGRNEAVEGRHNENAGLPLVTADGVPIQPPVFQCRHCKVAGVFGLDAFGAPNAPLVWAVDQLPFWLATLEQRANQFSHLNRRESAIPFSSHVSVHKSVRLPATSGGEESRVLDGDIPGSHKGRSSTLSKGLIKVINMIAVSCASPPSCEHSSDSELSLLNEPKAVQIISNYLRSYVVSHSTPHIGTVTGESKYEAPTEMNRLAGWIGKTLALAASQTSGVLPLPVMFKVAVLLLSAFIDLSADQPSGHNVAKSQLPPEPRQNKFTVTKSDIDPTQHTKDEEISETARIASNPGVGENHGSGCTVGPMINEAVQQYAPATKFDSPATKNLAVTGDNVSNSLWNNYGIESVTKAQPHINGCSRQESLLSRSNDVAGIDAGHQHTSTFPPSKGPSNREELPVNLVDPQERLRRLLHNNVITTFRKRRKAIAKEYVDLSSRAKKVEGTNPLLDRDWYTDEDYDRLHGDRPPTPCDSSDVRIAVFSPQFQKSPAYSYSESSHVKDPMKVATNIGNHLTSCDACLTGKHLLRFPPHSSRSEEDFSHRPTVSFQNCSVTANSSGHSQWRRPRLPSAPANAMDSRELPHKHTTVPSVYDSHATGCYCTRCHGGISCLMDQREGAPAAKPQHPGKNLPKVLLMQRTSSRATSESSSIAAANFEAPRSSQHQRGRLNTNNTTSLDRVGLPDYGNTGQQSAHPILSFRTTQSPSIKNPSEMDYNAPGSRKLTGFGPSSPPWEHRSPSDGVSYIPARVPPLWLQGIRLANEARPTHFLIAQSLLTAGPGNLLSVASIPAILQRIDGSVIDGQPVQSSQPYTAFAMVRGLPIDFYGPPHMLSKASLTSPTRNSSRIAVEDAQNNIRSVHQSSTGCSVNGIVDFAAQLRNTSSDLRQLSQKRSPDKSGCPTRDYIGGNSPDVPQRAGASNFVQAAPIVSLPVASSVLRLDTPGKRTSPPQHEQRLAELNSVNPSKNMSSFLQAIQSMVKQQLGTSYTEKEFRSCVYETVCHAQSLLASKNAGQKPPATHSRDADKLINGDERGIEPVPTEPSPRDQNPSTSGKSRTKRSALYATKNAPLPLHAVRALRKESELRKDSEISNMSPFSQTECAAAASCPDVRDGEGTTASLQNGEQLSSQALCSPITVTGNFEHVLDRAPKLREAYESQEEPFSPAAMGSANKRSHRGRPSFSKSRL